MENRLATDPRIDPRLKALLGQMEPTALPHVESREEALAQSALLAQPEVNPAIYEAASPSEGLVIGTRRIASQPDGNSINLQVIMPEGEGPFGCVYYMHGGGMMAGSCFDPMYGAWGRLVAAQGVAVVMVDFRNSLLPSSVPEIEPYPAGLNDCVSGLHWVHNHAQELGIDPARIVIAGESGGGNLALAVALRLKREGDIALLRAIYVMCPYLAGEWEANEGSSALENAGIMMTTPTNFGAMAYGIEELRARNPLAWPGFATKDDVAGFPPVVISVNECDPVRDDGVDFYRLLLRAGVNARCKILVGTVHATEVICLACPDISRRAARELAALCSED